MRMHLFLLACLLLADTFQAQHISAAATSSNHDYRKNTYFHNFIINPDRIIEQDEHYYTNNNDHYLFERNILSGAERQQSGISTVINAFLGFSNSTVGLKNVALEHSSSSFVLLTEYSTLMMDSCISNQKSDSPFHLQSGSINMANLSVIPQMNIYSGSLMISSDHKNSVILRNSIIADLAVSSSDYFLLSGKSQNEQIDNCAFRNMSVKLDKNSDCQMEHSCCSSSMENTLIYSCMNAFEGGISSGSYSSQEFICKNTTINFGKREMNDLERKRRMDTTESQSFSLCEWVDCTAPQGGALYVHENENAILTVENCSFTRCNASSTKGGGIYALKIAECIVTHTTFVQCTCAAKNSDYEGGGILIESIYVQPIIDDCLFNNCSSGEDGGAVDIRETKTQRQKKCFINSFFDNCRCNGTNDGEGGAIVHCNSMDKVVISNCYFCNCFSMTAGGAISQHINTNNDGILFFYCFFHNNTCMKGGHDIVLQDSTSNNIDSSCYTTRQTDNRVSTKYDSIDDRSEWLRNDFGRIRFVSSVHTEPNSVDTYACGMDKIYPCNTISHCFTQLIPNHVADIEILTGTIKETKSVDCSSNTFTIYGQSDMSTAIQTEFEESSLSLFSVSTGTLIISDLILVHDSVHENNRASRLFEITGTGEMRISALNISFGSEQSAETAFTTELINVQNGMFQMNNVNLTKTISSTSLFSLSSANGISLTLSECSFDEIERTTGGAAVMSFSNDKANIDLNSCSFSGCGSTLSENGGLMMLCVGNENEVKVKGGSFDGCFCSTSNGLGGGILLRLMNDNPDFQISSSFGTNTAKWGRDIFVFSPNLEAIANPQKISCVTATLDSVDKVRGYDNGNTSVAIPLCIYLLPIPEEIHVSNTEASDHSHCGIVQFPCLTLKHSIKRQTGTKKVKVNGIIAMSDELTFAEQKHEIRGNDDQSGLTVSDSSSTSNSAMITTSIETELSKLIFSLPPSFSSHSTFISSSSQLTLNQCSLSLRNPSLELTFLFLSVESGILTIDKFSALSIVLNGNPLISLSGSCTRDELMNTKWLNMTNCNFKEIERTDGNGGCLSIDNSDDEDSNSDINIEECIFDECSVLAEGSRGGAIDAQLKGNILLNIVSCTFTGCTAPAGEGKTGFGGGMALKLIDDCSSFVISSPVFDFDKPNVARYGNDLFVESSNLTKSITNASLPFVSENLADISLDSMSGFEGNDTANAIPLVYFWRTFGSEIFIGGDGKDVCVCGLSDYPCQSIDYSLDRLPEGNEKNINIIGKGVLQKSVDVSGVSLKSDENSMCSLECHSSIEGGDEAAMKTQGITNLELMKFVIPSSFTSGVNVLIHVGSSEGLLTLKDCSFTKNEESREEIMNYGLIKADGGTVKLEFVTIQSLSFSKDVISMLSTTILNVKNLTMKDVQLDGASGLSIVKSSRREKNEAEQDVLIEWSIFEEVAQNTTNDIPIIRNDNDDEPLKMVIRNTTMKKCGGTRCRKGGGMFCVLNEEGNFDCSFCTISECFCSTTGRGGWLFLECTSTVEHPLNFVLSNITFKDNSALKGRDAYVQCHSIETQIVDEQFLLDFRAPFVKDLAVWGCTTDSFEGEEDLLLRVVKYLSETIFVSSVSENHKDSKQCGEFSMPCQSLDVGVQHIIPSSYSQLLISKETVIVGECEAMDLIIRSLQSSSAALFHLNSTININEGSLITTSETVRIEKLKFDFGQSFSYSGSSIIHEANAQLSLSSVDFSSVGQSENIESVVLNSTLLSIENGILHIDNCLASFLSFKKPSFLFSGKEISLTNMKLENIESTTNVFEIAECKEAVFNGISADRVSLSEGCVFSINEKTSGSVSVVSSSFNNCSRNSEGASVLSVSSTSAQIDLSNCSCSNSHSLYEKGSVVEVSNSTDVSMSLCRFDGELEDENENENRNEFKEMCRWNGSVVDVQSSNVGMKDTTISNSKKGGLSLSGGSVEIYDGRFENNNPSIANYGSARRNILCGGSGRLRVVSLKGGDGVKDNTSLWILDEGCALEGIAGERESPFFIPRVESVSSEKSGEVVDVVFRGSVLLPCNLSFKTVAAVGDEEVVEKYLFDESGFISEEEVHGSVPVKTVEGVPSEAEVRVSILFGSADSPSATDSFVLKNRSESKTSGDERIAEGGKEGKSIWPIIVIVMAIILLIVLIISVIFIVRWRKQKRRAEELEVIVNDNIKKDPKLIEMMTMEMSPEEQWRRAEREAEKKNEERIKKRVYAKSLGHSESSEHLLSESGSTEYILGRDSDKIPEWMLEKVDEKEEEEETRKRSPSPSISTTCSTDSDSTFVRGEDLCPTTSSMSNLVDAMACSSPHEKLIVDLRDSLFMLLHGRNEKKEMAIGSLQQREQTAAQILFWVANGALHSFDEIENTLSSLSNLSPHIVLFSEHMVICIVMHSDFSSDDSDSSSISSSTVVTSASDGDDDDSLPSSAFEDEEDSRYECLRWKAPELLMNKKIGATKESVSFSIGMMLWECLTLQIPFGEYEAEMAGKKIVNGVRPEIGMAEESTLGEVSKNCMLQTPSERPSLVILKREFIQRFPAGAVVMTISDAVDIEYETGDCEESNNSSLEE
ncbi:uncharacterized protein MONOS_3659fu3660 [Monocercomonoides exilis]|uniref:uncharacterized protein n=1 Tax=Monocercomonoides exilis TaxID=2049356 RepID=UPI003559DCAD|nr:hypothetical protein MONOS_3659fu3660 [Monocercomonoides exilis]